MNSFQAMHFVDTASPQQLKAMVDSQNPYSFMALAKLQQIRDAAMRQKAHEPVPPPLSQQIPQELARAEAPAIPQTPVGIASLAPQMPQQPQAGIGREMATAAAGGGLVAFREGGVPGFNGANDYAPSFLTQYLEELKQQGNPYTPNYMDQMRKMRRERVDPVTGGPAPAADGSLSRLKPLGSVLTLVPDRAAAEAAAIRSATDTTGYNEPMNLSANTAATLSGNPEASGIRNPNLLPGANSAANGSTGDGMYGRIMAMMPTKKDLDAVTAARNQQITDLEEIRKGMAPDMEAFKKAQGDIGQERERLRKSYEELFPDPNKEIRGALAEMKAENVKSLEQAPYQGMLKMALALMGTDRTNLFQAVGKAGGVGLEEMNRITEAAKQEKMKLLEADARVAAAQDARRRGDYEMATREAMQSRADRMDAFRYNADAKAAQANVAAQLAAQRAGLPAEKIELQGKMVGALATIHQAFKDPAAPEAVRVWQFAQKNPAFLDQLQTQKDAEAAQKQFSMLERQYDDDLKAGAIIDPKMTKDKYVNEGMTRFLSFQQKQRTPRGTMPAQ